MLIPNRKHQLKACHLDGKPPFRAGFSRSSPCKSSKRRSSSGRNCFKEARWSGRRKNAFEPKLRSCEERPVLIDGALPTTIAHEHIQVEHKHRSRVRGRFAALGSWPFGEHHARRVA